MQIASVQTLHARAVRSSKIEPPPAALLVVDEAHHARAQTYRAILQQYPSAIVVGLTATPCRGDGRGLGNLFETMVECPQVAELIKGGFLVPSLVYAPSRPDLAGVEVRRGDYVESQLAERVDTRQLVGDIVVHWLRLANRRKTVVFATGVQHSVHIRDQFRVAGVWAEHLDGSTPTGERDAILAKLAAGTVDVVCNAMVLTEGWDCPSASCLVLARPSKSLGLFRQMVGRVLRPAPGKFDALILDHAGAVFEHGLPEEPITWKLSEDQRAENATHGLRTRQRMPTLTICPECAAIRLQGQPCGSCGWRPVVKPQAVEIAEGDLARVDHGRRALHAGATVAERMRFFGMLCWYVDERGYKPGWAAHKFREKFGDWPPWRHVEALVPTDEARAWVRSRAVAYAKSRSAA